MPRLFEKNNTEVLNEIMAVFWQLLAFHDPELWWHLEGMGFKPDLFAIPWYDNSKPLCCMCVCVCVCVCVFVCMCLLC